MGEPLDGAAGGVLLMAYGTPGSPDEIDAFYTHIRRGRPPTPEQLADLRRRYDAIGGLSPLRARTEAQASALQRALGSDFRVELGMKHASPFIEDAVDALRRQGVTRAVALVLAPHYSALSVGEYMARSAKAAGDELQIVPVLSWHLEDALVDALARRVRDALASMPAAARVVFTAHSLPERVATTGDPCQAQVRETAAAVAERAGLGRDRWTTAWQSAGRTDEAWLGPDILEVLRAEVASGAVGVMVCPCGFVSDHLEVLYDLDVDAARLAAQLDLPFARTQSLDDDASLVAALAGVVRRAWAEAGSTQAGSTQAGSTQAGSRGT